MEDGSANNGGDLHEVAVEDDGSMPQTEEVSALKNQVESLSKELKSSKSTIASLEAKIEGYEKAYAEAAVQIEQLQGEAKAMCAVAARASDLEGDVARLQHELIATMTGSEENAAEAASSKKALEELEGEKTALKAAVAALEVKTSGLEAEKEKIEVEVARKEEQIRELEEKVNEIEDKLLNLKEQKEAEMKALRDKIEELLKDVAAKDVEVARARDLAGNAMMEANELRCRVDELAKTNVTSREVEIKVGGGRGGQRDWTSTITMAAVPTATAIAIGAAVSYLHYTRRR